MADEKYTIPENPQYKIADIRKLKDTDPASATETFNPVFEPILESVDYLNKHKAALDTAGKVPESQLPALGGHIAQAEAPGNTNLLWIDTANGNIIKFYDSVAKSWKPAAAVWS
ncbi:hypothetical protein I5Q82_06375 [Acutalibacter muris]|uniref:Uncharacterized protein n=1 Tax=Acutalibacter muris TaxID=1796620 RepID=A0A1Z2XUB6_9FIRM|nr:hypothetical protein [Acutalibacter muris]ANU54746.1 hypothetical protein A4V00_12370 [Hungateiclostridiaceae bacterium KB18]ASB42023.1 hypothetical protein ADH66_16000 [Acutalibacter muris]QQR31291.1 hypothetical protein I5Q82_06375 [Acutalibacter muris]